jgi:hypothetical protein
MFPHNRIQAVLATMEGAFTERLSGLAAIGQGLSGHLARGDALITVLEARRACLLNAAVEKYDGWRDTVVPNAETGGEYIAAVAESLGRLTENTQQTGLRAARHLQAMALAVLVALNALIRGDDDQKRARQEAPPGRRLTAGQVFTLARMTARVPLKFWEWQSHCISAITHPVCLRYALPLPRSESPSRGIA